VAPGRLPFPALIES